MRVEDSNKSFYSIHTVKIMAELELYIRSIDFQPSVYAWGGAEEERGTGSKRRADSFNTIPLGAQHRS